MPNMAARSPGAATVGAIGICAALIAIVLWPSGSPSVHAQELSVPGCTVEAEPNDTLDAAQMVRVADCPDDGIVIHGDIEGFELDLYRFEVPDGPPTLRDVTVLPTDAAPHGLCLRSEVGDHRQCRQGSDGTALPDLLLTPGDHVIEIKGGSDASFDYELQVRPAGPWTPALEAEPNDHIYVASPFELAT